MLSAIAHPNPAIPASQVRYASRLVTLLPKQLTEPAMAAGVTLDRESIDSEARLAFWVATRDWRPDTGCAFTSYAFALVRRYVVEEMRRQSFHKRAGAERVRRYLQAGRELEGWMQPPTSLMERVFAEGDETRLLDILPDRETNVEQGAVGRVNRDEVRAILCLLEPREQEVLYRIYWLEQTGPQIAAALGVCESRIHQIKAEALKQLRRDAYAREVCRAA